MVTNTQYHFLAAGNCKEDYYGSLLLDLQYAGFPVDLVTVKIGCLGHFISMIITKLSNVCQEYNNVAYFSRQLMLPFPVCTGYLTLRLRYHGM